MKYFVLLVIILFKSSCSAQNNVKDGKNKSSSIAQVLVTAPDKLEYSIDLSTLKASNLDLLGFNSANTFANCDINDSQYKDLVSQLAPDLLRFPGGSIANFYHMDGKGYGFKKQDFVLNEGSVSKHVNNMLRKNDELKITTNYIDDFIALAKSVNAEVLYVANITSGTPEEAIKIITYLKDHNLKVKGIVLGNELYLNGYKKIVPNASQFKEIAMPFVKEFRKTYPTIPIAIPAESKGILKMNYESEWNNEMSKENFYDAIVIHVYPDEPKCPTDNLTELFNCAQKDLSNYLNTIFPQRLSFFASQYSGKRMWITEWNMKKPGNNIGSTNLQALYAAQFLMKVSEWNSKNKRIDLTSFHNLSSDEYAYSIINPSSNGYIANPAYYTFKLYSVLSHKLWQYASYNKGNVNAGVYYNKENNELHFFIINNTSKDLDLANVTISVGKQKVRTSKISSQHYSGKTLYATDQVAGFLDDTANFSDKEEVLKKYNTFSISNVLVKQPNTIPAYSFTRISYQLNP